MIAFESYFTVKNLIVSDVFVWASSIDALTLMNSKDLQPKTVLQTVWELEDGSRLVDPIQVAVLAKPLKIICLFKVKPESRSSVGCFFIKSVEVEKNNRQKLYELNAFIPNCSLRLT